MAESLLTSRHTYIYIYIYINIMCETPNIFVQLHEIHILSEIVVGIAPYDSFMKMALHFFTKSARLCLALAWAVKIASTMRTSPPPHPREARMSAARIFEFSGAMNPWKSLL